MSVRSFISVVLLVPLVLVAPTGHAQASAGNDEVAINAVDADACLNTPWQSGVCSDAGSPGGKDCRAATFWTANVSSKGSFSTENNATYTGPVTVPDNALTTTSPCETVQGGGALSPASFSSGNGCLVGSILGGYFAYKGSALTLALELTYTIGNSPTNGCVGPGSTVNNNGVGPGAMVVYGSFTVVPTQFQTCGGSCLYAFEVHVSGSLSGID